MVTEDAPTPPVSLELLDARVQHLVIVADLTAKSVERLEDTWQDLRQERRALERVARTLSSAALNLAASKALSVLVPPTRLVAAVSLASFIGGFVAQCVALKLGIEPFSFAR